MQLVRPSLSIVTTLYCSALTIDEFFKRARESALKVSDNIEFVFVIDGSPDNSLSKARELLDSDVRVKVVNLSRNFGHHKAMMTGLQHASGDRVFIIDSDLEENPELIETFTEKMNQDTDIDVVFGYQRQRQRSFLRRILGNAFYIIFNLLSDIKIHKNLCVARLMSRRYLNQLLKHKETEIMISGLWAYTGFKQVPVAIEKSFKHRSSYDLRRHSRLMLHAIVSFSGVPLMMIFWLGNIVLLISAAMIAWLVISFFMRGYNVSGWTSTITSVWFLGGLILFSLGTLGAYLSILFNEVKSRPMTIVKEISSNIREE